MNKSTITESMSNSNSLCNPLNKRYQQFDSTANIKGFSNVDTMQEEQDQMLAHMIVNQHSLNIFKNVEQQAFVHSQHYKQAVEVKFKIVSPNLINISIYTCPIPIKIRFIIIDKNHSISSLKVVLMTEQSKEIILLFQNHLVLNYLLKQEVKFYIKPSKKVSNHITFMQTDRDINSYVQIFQPYEIRGRKIQFMSSCTYNGLSDCIVFCLEGEKLIVINQSQIVAIFEGWEQNKQQQYWIKFRQNWISFGSKDHKWSFLWQLSIQKQIKKQMMSQLKREQNYKVTIKKYTTPTNQIDWQDSSKRSTNCINDQYTGERQKIRTKSDLHIRRQLFTQSTMEDEMYQNNHSQMIDEVQEINQQKEYFIDNQQIPHSQKMMDEDIQIAKNINHDQIIQTINFSKVQPNLLVKQEQYNLHNGKDEWMSNKFCDFQSIKMKYCIQDPKPQFLNNFQEKQNNQNQSNYNSTLKQQKISEIITENILEPFKIKQNINKFNQLTFNLSSQIKPLQAEFHKSQEIKVSIFQNVIQLSSSLLVLLTCEHRLYTVNRMVGKFQIFALMHEIKIDNIYQTSQENMILYTEQDSTNLYSLNIITRERYALVDLKNDKQSIKDLKVIHNTIVFITTDKIVVMDVVNNQATHRIQRKFIRNQKFEKMALFDSFVIIGQSKGILKIFNINNLYKRSINNVQLKRLGNINNKGQFTQIKALKSGDIFCVYSNSAFLIDLKHRQSKRTIYQTLKLSQRPNIRIFTIPTQIIEDQNRLNCNFSLNRNKTQIISLYGNWRVNFKVDNGAFQIKSLLNEKQIKYCYLSYSEFEQNDGIVAGVLNKSKFEFNLIQ